VHLFLVHRFMLTLSPTSPRRAAAMKLMEAERNSQLLAGSFRCHAASYLFPET